ncbi:P-loop containing nucleoside triphosphate hydrolase protein [Ramicandelaber brevisporus]|nr:P-loop containing nucleoside triphosphate hydrolase protein [Ramicandelaber brevisporus]
MATASSEPGSPILAPLYVNELTIPPLPAHHPPSKASRTSPLIIGVAGGRGAGKKSVCTELIKRLAESQATATSAGHDGRGQQQQQQQRVLFLNMDNFRRPLNGEELELARNGKFNFDHPDSFDFDKLHEVLVAFRSNQPVSSVPVWNTETLETELVPVAQLVDHGSRSAMQHAAETYQPVTPPSLAGRSASHESQSPSSILKSAVASTASPISPSVTAPNAESALGFGVLPDIIILEGVLLLYKRKIRDVLSMKIFIDDDGDTRLSRIVTSTIRVHGENGAGSNLAETLNRYQLLGKPAFEEFILPTKRWADVIVPRGRENKVALDVLHKTLEDM